MVAGGDNPWLDGGQAVQGEMTTYKSGSDTLEAFMARPTAQGPKPGKTTPLSPFDAAYAIDVVDR